MKRGIRLLLRICFIILSVLLTCNLFSQDTWTATTASGNVTAGVNWTSTSTWTCSGSNCAGRNYPGYGGVVNDIVIIERPVNFSSTSALSTITIASLTIRNVNSNDARLSVYGNSSGANGRTLNITGDVAVTASSTRNAILRIYDNASVNIDGNLTMTRETTHRNDYTAQLDIYNSASLSIDGNFSYSNLTTTAPTVDAETTNEIDLGELNDTSYPTVSIGGDLNITLNTNQTGNLNTVLRGSSSLTVGSDGTGNVNILLTASGVDPLNNINVYLSNSTISNIASDGDNTSDGSDATLTVNGNMNLVVQDDSDAPDIRLYIRGTSDLVINGNVNATNNNTVVSTGAGTNTADIQFKLVDDGKVTCNSFSFTSSYDTDTNNIYINQHDNSYFTFNGDIVMDAPDNSPVANYISLDDNATLDLKGNVSRTNHSGVNSDGAIEFLDNSNSLIRFSGSVAQTIFPTYTAAINSWQENYDNITARVYRRMEIANTSGTPLTLNEHVAIRTSLTLTEGIIETTSAAYIVFPYVNPVFYTIVSSNEGTTTSYIDGPVRKFGPNAITLPLGDGTSWAPVYIDNITIAGGDQSVYPDLLFEYHASTPPSVTTDFTVASISNVEYWSVYSNDAYAHNVTADINFRWKDACFSEITSVSTSPQDLYMAETSTTTWTLHNASTIQNSSAACDNTTIAYETGSVTATAIVLTPAINGTTYNFTFGSSGAVLPVELISISAERNKSDVVLEWTSATEINVLKYIIERKTEHSDFVAIGEISATGTTSAKTNYSFTDKNPPAYFSYYRLKMVDLDGYTEYSRIVTVKQDMTDTHIFTFTDGFWLESLVKKEPVQITIYSALGMELFRGVINDAMQVDTLVENNRLLIIYGRTQYKTQMMKLMAVDKRP